MSKTHDACENCFMNKDCAYQNTDDVESCRDVRTAAIKDIPRLRELLAIKEKRIDDLEQRIKVLEIEPHRQLILSSGKNGHPSLIILIHGYMAGSYSLPDVVPDGWVQFILDALKDDMQFNEIEMKNAELVCNRYDATHKAKKG